MLDIARGGYSTRPIFTHRESYDDELGRATTKRIGSLVPPPALSLTALLRYLPLTGRALFLMSRCGAVLCPVVG